MRSDLGRLAAILTVLAAAGCTLTSAFSERAYDIATSAKVDGLAVVAQATEPFANHAAEVQTLKLEVEKAYEFARGRPHNEEATRQWAIIRDPERNSLGGFLRRWEERGTLDATYVAEAQGIISDGFDTVIGLESGKSTER